MENVVSLLTYFVTLSVAAERFVEILKRTVLKNVDPPGVVFQALSATFGAGLAFYSPPPTEILVLDPYVAVAVTALAVSGGSSFWNTALESFSSIAKNLKEVKP